MDRLLLPLLLLAVAGAAPTPPEKPVMVGAIADLDACLSNARVTGLDRRGDNFLAVRSRPAASARELGRLRSGQIVWACDQSADGRWTGIVYAPPNPPIDCRVGTPWLRRTAYRGPCRSGWVSSRWLTIIAG